ncbi:MAG: divergent polysaccharide deacetylase family protein [Spirochaetales bacterium]|nr:divergent polysaccharide deacetylase family protein [Spirochaetales bacterium]
MENRRLKVVIILLSVIIVLLVFTVILINNITITKSGKDDSGILLSEEVITDKKDIKEPTLIPAETIEAPPGVLYFVIDDVGNNLFQLKPFLELPMNITFAVLPGLKYTKEAINLIREAGKDYIIHQPMEAVGGQNPGPGALLLGMTQDEVRTIVTDNIKVYYGVQGMNNHMGSAGTADYELMSFLYNVLKENEMGFLDSRTTSKSVGRELSDKVGIPFVERSIFLDNSKERQAILEAVENGLNVSEKKGHAIMIGHIWTDELAGILLELYPSLLENNYILNNLTELFTGKEFDEDSWY